MTVPKSLPKILARKGQKQVGTFASAERGQLVTVEMCVSASGDQMPPMFIYPGSAPIPEAYAVGAPENSTFVRTSKGWIDKETFFIWFKKFVAYTRASKERPVAMICDGHPSHKYNLELLQYATDHGVIIICLPPHCTHRMQPLDVTCMR
ncbi:uncharacterized protein LOC107040397 [Diachasma alloeum]|uniref:uncharacterized protein LOC107040397 n=1 Tax=Diachasma alloeum TaxID=454923 RepID=UPI000738248F|nr:uncharacterized protein LOC107040397 [Diachasma alloeum]